MAADGAAAPRPVGGAPPRSGAARPVGCVDAGLPDGGAAVRRRAGRLRRGHGAADGPDGDGLDGAELVAVLRGL